MPSGIVFVNPRSGRTDTAPADLEGLFPDAAVEACSATDLPARVEAAVSEGAAFVGVAGGDGSIRCAASVLAGSGVPLLAVPAGTRNHFAGALGLDEVEQAVEAARGGRTRLVDVAEVNGHCFVNNASIGFYAGLVRERTRHEHRLPRAAADVAAAWAQARHGHRFWVQVDGRRYRAWLVFVGNGCYGDSLTDLGRRDDLDAHVLDLRLLRADAVLARTRAVVAVVLGRLGRLPLLVRDVREQVELDVPGRGTVDVALDGELLALDLPLRFRSRPAALAVLVP